MKNSIVTSMLALNLSACTSSTLLESQNLTEFQPISEAEGVVYTIPKSYVHVTLKRECVTTGNAIVGKPKATIEVGENLIFMPDPKHTYFLKYKHKANSNTTVDIVTSGTGVLSNITTVTSDQGPATVKAVSKQLSDFASSGIVTDKFLPSASAEEFEISAVLPLNDINLTVGEWSEFNDILKNSYGANLTPTSSAISTTMDLTHLCRKGVCYRTAAPARLTYTDGYAGYSTCKKDGSHVSDITKFKAKSYTRIITAPIGPIVPLSIVRRPGVENKYTLSFTNGMLTNYKVEDPSTVASVASVPVDVLKAIASIPSAALQFKVSSDTKNLKLENEKASLDVQKALLEAQIELLKKEAALKELKKK